MDEELRDAERRGDAERVEALRRRAGLPAVPAELPALLAAYDHAQGVHDTAHEGGEFSTDPRGELREEADRRRAAVWECLRASGLEPDEALLRAAEGSRDPRARGRASILLSEGAPTEAIQRRLVASGWPEVQGPAARRAMAPPPPQAGRGRWTGPPAWVADAVREALRATAPGQDRAPLLEQLATLDPRGSVELFAAHLDDGHPHVVWRACQGLVLARDLRAWPALERLVDHPGPTVVTCALQALALLDLPGAASVAAGRLRDGRVDVPRQPRPFSPDPFKAVLNLLLDAADARCWPHLAGAGEGPRGEWARGLLANQAKHGLTGPADFARPEVAERLRAAGRLRRDPGMFLAYAYDVLRELSDLPARAT